MIKSKWICNWVWWLLQGLSYIWAWCYIHVLFRITIQFNNKETDWLTRPTGSSSMNSSLPLQLLPPLPYWNVYFHLRAIFVIDQLSGCSALYSLSYRNIGVAQVLFGHTWWCMIQMWWLRRQVMRQIVKCSVSTQYQLRQQRYFVDACSEFWGVNILGLRGEWRWVM